MPRRQNRITTQSLEQAGIAGVPGPNVSDDIQLTYSLGDLSPLLPALPQNTIYWLAARAALGAGQYSGFTLAPRANSHLLVAYLENNSVGAAELILDFGLTANVVAAAQSFEDPAAVVTTANIETGSTPLGGAGAGLQIPAGAAAPAGLYPIRVSPGNRFTVLNTVVNQAIACLVVWREVAAPPPTL